jgi:chaperonin GroES
MITAAKQFFVVRIDKQKQIEKRNNLVKSNFGFLGIQHSQQEGDEKLNGVRVWNTEIDSPAQKAGFKPNDIIKFINGKPVTSYEQLVDAVAKNRPGTSIKISYINSLLITEELSEKDVVLGEKPFNIINPETLVDFQFNLQYGEVMFVGSLAHQNFPEVNVGDILLFHHAVEGKPRGEGDKNYNDHHLLETLPNGDEYRTVNYVTEVFGVLKTEEATIIPYKNYIFCHKHIEKSEFQMQNGVWVPDDWGNSIEQLQERIEKLKEEKDVIANSSVLREKTTELNYKRKEEISTKIRAIQKESLEITKRMNTPKIVELVALFINPLTVEELEEDIQPGSKLLAEFGLLYPFDICGQYYTLLRKDYTEAHIVNLNNHNMSQEKFPLRPLKDRVLIKPDEAERKTAGGVIIPDTALEKPQTGVVVASGIGLKDLPNETREGDHVLYGKFSGTELSYQNETYLMVRESDILAIDDGFKQQSS